MNKHFKTLLAITAVVISSALFGATATPPGGGPGNGPGGGPGSGPGGGPGGGAAARPGGGAVPFQGGIQFGNNRHDDHYGRPGGAGQPGRPGGAGQPGRPGEAGQPGRPGGAGQPGRPGGAGYAGQPGRPGGAGQPGGAGYAGQPGRPGGAGFPSAPGSQFGGPVGHRTFPHRHPSSKFGFRWYDYAIGGVAYAPETYKIFECRNCHLVQYSPIVPAVEACGALPGYGHAYQILGTYGQLAFTCATCGVTVNSATIPAAGACGAGVHVWQQLLQY